MSDFDRAMAFVLKWEGGHSNDQSDPGGETKYGISKKAHPTVDIKALTVEKAREIYAKDYWAKAGCAQMDWPMCLVVFDTAVNLGVRRALDFKAQAFNWTDYLFLRLSFYSNTGKPQFLKGWLNRVIDLHRTAKSM